MDIAGAWRFRNGCRDRGDLAPRVFLQRRFSDSGNFFRGELCFHVARWIYRVRMHDSRGGVAIQLGDFQLEFTTSDVGVPCVWRHSLDCVRGLWSPSCDACCDHFTMTNETTNNRMHTNRRSAFQFRCSGFIRRWIGCQRPLTAAVGDPCRSA